MDTKLKFAYKGLSLICICSLLFFSSILSAEPGTRPEKGPLVLANIDLEVWGSYELRHMLFSNELWTFYVVVVPESVRQGTLIEIAKEFYSKYPNTRVRFFSNTKHIQQYVDRDVYVNDKTGLAKEAQFPDSTWVRNHLIGNINNRSSIYPRHWMLEDRYGSMIALLP
jgi:hypothetical protein